MIERWSTLALSRAGEATKSIKTNGRPVLEKNYHAAVIKERYEPHCFVIASAFFFDHSVRDGL